MIYYMNDTELIEYSIYILYSPHMTKVYVGSTKDTLEVRLQLHEAHHAAYLLDRPLSAYCSSYEILEASDYSIELLEEFSCTKYDEIKKIKEAYHIGKYNCINIYLQTKGVSAKMLAERARVARYDITHKAQKKEYMAKHYVNSKLKK